MKIGIDASRLTSEHSTGVEHYSWQIIKGILAQLATEKLKGAGEKLEIVLYSRIKLPKEIMEVFAGAENMVIERKRLWTILGLAKEMRANPEQTLFVPSHTLPPILPEKSVITIHDVAFKYLRKAYSFKQFHYLNLSTKFAVKRASKIIVPSEATRQDLMNFYGCESEKIVVVPHGFEAPQAPKDEEKILTKSPVFKHFGIKKTTNYILFVGRLESKKNLVRLVEAFAEFSKLNSDFLLVLAGKRGVGFQSILDKVKKLGIMEKVIMPGYVTEDEKFVFYKYCKFFAFPSLYEGFGFPILEAFCHEKPVMCANVSSLPEVGGAAVHYVDPYDKNSIVDGLLALAKSNKYTADLVKCGKKRLPDFDWKKAAKLTLKTLKNC